MTFKDLGIIDPILNALSDEGYTNPTPIQEQSIPILLEGRDLLGCAQTGTGKTAAFAIPILQQLIEKGNRLDRHPKIKALVVSPTRELAIQIADSFKNYSKYTDLKTAVIYGGVKQGSQTAVLRKGVDILVATPGRLLDLINQGFISLKDVEYSVLDEADQMLDMGFIHDIRKLIAKLPKKRQSLFFSATMPTSIVELSGTLLGNPEKITVKPQQVTTERVEQALYFVSKPNKPKLLVETLSEKGLPSTIVFTRTKHGADKVVRILQKSKIPAEAIHGNKSQNARQRALKNFKDGQTKVLVATDIAARGIDVSGLELVINYELPNVSETYVHRIGRTGRAEASGIALSFCDEEEKEYLIDIQKLIRLDIKVISDHAYANIDIDEVLRKPSKKKSGAKKPQSGGRRSSGGNRSSNSRSSSSRGGRTEGRSEGRSERRPRTDSRSESSSRGERSSSRSQSGGSSKSFTKRSSNN